MVVISLRFDHARALEAYGEIEEAGLAISAAYRAARCSRSALAVVSADALRALFSIAKDRVITDPDFTIAAAKKLRDAAIALHRTILEG
ncbi:MAG: hypothetical protein IMX05_01370 [Hydrogenibacillus schlegelii]|nr:hypothetical protein [Hydrogenibacillus schlegelii]